MNAQDKGIYYPLPEKYKYSVAFTSILTPILPEEANKYLSLASQQDFKKYLPQNIDFSEKVDFLGICGEAFVVNELNANDDGVKTKEGLRIADLFPYSFIDVNHSRNDIVGVVIESSFAEKGTGRKITKDEAAKLNTPFSVILSGIVWKIANPKIAKVIEASTVPGSEWYNQIFFSWELAFTDYNLIKIDANKTSIKDGKLITNPEEIEALTNKLRSYGGKGLDKDGLKIGRIPIGDVIPVGLGIVENPAGQVQPLASKSNMAETSDAQIINNTENNMNTNNNSQLNTEAKKACKAAMCPECGQEMDVEDNDEMEHTCGKCGKKSMGKMWKLKANVTTEDLIKNLIEVDKKAVDAAASLATILEKITNSSNSISQSQTNTVNEHENNNTSMKITNFDELTEDNIKECKASDIKEMLKNRISEISKDYEKTVAEKEAAANLAAEAKNSLENKYKEIEAKFVELEAAHNKIVSEIEAKAKLDKFSARMSTVSDTYELNEKQTAVVGEEVKAIETDEAFAKYLEKVSLFLTKKEAKPAAQPQTALASNTDTNGQGQLQNALNNATPKPATLPNAAEGQPKTQAEIAKEAFGLKGWKVVSSRKVNK